MPPGGVHPINLSSYKGPKVEQLIKAAGAELRYLPPYSADMNPIEKAYSKLKAFLRKIAERTVAGLLIALDACVDIFKPTEWPNYFRSNQPSMPPLPSSNYNTDLL